MSYFLNYDGYNPYDNPATPYYYRWVQEMGIKDIYCNETYYAWLRYLETPQAAIDCNNWFPHKPTVFNPIDDLPF